MRSPEANYNYNPDHAKIGAYLLGVAGLCAGICLAAIQVFLNTPPEATTSMGIIFDNTPVLQGALRAAELAFTLGASFLGGAAYAFRNAFKQS